MIVAGGAFMAHLGHPEAGGGVIGSDLRVRRTARDREAQSDDYDAPEE